MKSIHFTQAPTMRGKRTKRYTDIVVENFKHRELAKVHQADMKTWDDEFWRGGKPIGEMVR
jgi:hypothetical protein